METQNFSKVAEKSVPFRSFATKDDGARMVLGCFWELNGHRSADPSTLHVYGPYNTFPAVLAGATIERLVPHKKVHSRSYQSPRSIIRDHDKMSESCTLSKDSRMNFKFLLK